MEHPENTVHLPPWRAILRVLAMLGGLVLLAVLSMVAILLVAKYFDKRDTLSPTAVFIDLSAPPAPRTRQPLPGSLDDFPVHPVRGMAYGGRGGEAGRAATAPPAPPAQAAVPVGLSADEYRAAVDSGKKLYLPNPEGKCDLGGKGSTQLAGALDRCFAPRAAR